MSTACLVFLLWLLGHTCTKAGFISITHDRWNVLISEESVPYEEALESCIAEESNLITLNEETKDRKVYDLLMRSGIELPGNYFWIGASEVREGVWTWTETGQPLFYSRWAIGQPDDTTSLNCAFIQSLYELYWRDGNCSASFFYICEKELPDVNLKEMPVY